jgi:hypothetical protein
MQLRLFLIRGLVAIVWGVVLLTASDSLTTGVGVLLVLYPLIDVVASIIDAREEQGSERQLLELNGGVSVAAAVALGIAATGDKGDVLAVFGVVGTGDGRRAARRRHPSAHGLGKAVAAADLRCRVHVVGRRLPHQCERR